MNAFLMSCIIGVIGGICGTTLVTFCLKNRKQRNAVPPIPALNSTEYLSMVNRIGMSMGTSSQGNAQNNVSMTIPMQLDGQSVSVVAQMFNGQPNKNGDVYVTHDFNIGNGGFRVPHPKVEIDSKNKIKFITGSK